MTSFGRDTVMGRVVHAVVAEQALRDGRPAMDLLDPISRLGGHQWGHLGQIDELVRIGFHEWPGHYDQRDNRHS
jgi:hypothetical protein